MTDELTDYLDKRDFSKTPEPEVGSKSEDPGRGPVFVIQKHNASSLHYDLRLQRSDEALASWAVPKGPSTDPDEKRLAIKTEDHPIDYASFEGRIPEDEYGGGTVIVWDAGIYTNLRDEMSVDESLEDGKVEFWLDGQKLKGGYVLIRTNYGDEDQEQWLLKKLDDDEADARRNPTSTEPESVLSGRTVEEVAENSDDPENNGTSD